MEGSLLQKCHYISADVDVNGFDDKFVVINLQTPDSNIHNDIWIVPLENAFSYRCANQLEVFVKMLSNENHNTCF